MDHSDLEYYLFISTIFYHDFEDSTGYIIFYNKNIYI